MALFKASDIVATFNKIIGIEGDFIVNNYYGIEKVREGVYTLLPDNPNIDTPQSSRERIKLSSGPDSLDEPSTKKIKEKGKK